MLPEWVRIQLNDVYVAKHEELDRYMAARDLSLDALTVAKEVIELNPANYMAWQFRRECLLKCKSDIQQDLDSIIDLGAKHAKAYQVWYHRRWCLERLMEGKPDAGELDARRKKEMEFIRHMLHLDARSYHAWSHRQVAVSILGIPLDEEFADIAQIIVDFPDNNSAWNHRYFLAQADIDKDREIAFTLGILRQHDLESVWAYLDVFVDDYSKIDLSFVDSCSPFLMERTASFAPSAREVYTKLEDVDSLHAKLWSWRRDYATT